MPAKQMRL